MFFLFTMLHYAFAMELLSFMASVYHKGKLAYVLSCGVFPIQSLVLLRRNIQDLCEWTRVGSLSISSWISFGKRLLDPSLWQLAPCLHLPGPVSENVYLNRSSSTKQVHLLVLSNYILHKLQYIDIYIYDISLYIVIRCTSHYIRCHKVCNNNIYSVKASNLRREPSWKKLWAQIPHEYCSLNIFVKCPNDQNEERNFDSAANPGQQADTLSTCS